jgi:GH24 family phage-related lysozyme (muramidase)
MNLTNIKSQQTERQSGYNALHEREGTKLNLTRWKKGILTIAIGNTFYLDGRKVTMNDKPS